MTKLRDISVPGVNGRTAYIRCNSIFEHKWFVCDVHEKERDADKQMAAQFILRGAGDVWQSRFKPDVGYWRTAEEALDYVLVLATSDTEDVEGIELDDGSW